VPFAGPVGRRGGGEFGAVVAMQHRGVATVLVEPIRLIAQPVAGHGGFDQTAQALARVLIDEGDDLDRPTVGRRVEWKSTPPHRMDTIGWPGSETPIGRCPATSHGLTESSKLALATGLPSELAATEAT
jgi:hypothetical protein